MKKTSLILMIVCSLFALAEPPQLEGYLIHDSVDKRGAFTTELVKIPEGATAAEYAANAIPVFDQPVAALPPKGILSLYPTEKGAVLVYVISFGEFAELLPMPTWTQPVIAQNNGEEIRPEKQPGILSRSLQVAKDNPWKTGIATFLLADYATGDGIDAFGLLGGDDDDSGRPTVNVSGSGNVVTITDNANSNNDNSNRPATAAPFFPPQAIQ